MKDKWKSVFLFASVLGILLVTVGVGWFVGTAAAQTAPDCLTVTYNGDGTETNPYEVSNVDQLQCINEQGLDAKYQLVSDIDASETEEWNDGKGFRPIGYSPKSGVGRPFEGTLGGAGHEINAVRFRSR